MNAVWNDAPYSGGTLLVLLALADWANDDGICWPKRPQIARKARLTESGAKFCLRQLRKDGAISLFKQSTGPGKPNLIRIGGQYLTPMGAAAGKKGGSSIARNKEEPPSKQPSEKIPPSPLAQGGSVSKQKIPPLTRRDLRKINEELARIEAASVGSFGSFRNRFERACERLLIDPEQARIAFGWGTWDERETKDA